MISSESSDEELENLHQRQAPPPRRKRDMDAVTKSKKAKATAVTSSSVSSPVKRPRSESASGNDDPTEPTTTSGASNAKSNGNGEGDGEKEEEGEEEEEEMTREEKKALRKKRKLERREQIAKEAEEKQRAAAQAERALKGRPYTLSIALPGSVLASVQTKELKTYIAGQIARAGVIFEVDEIIVFDDQLGETRNDVSTKKRANDCHVFLMRILQYLETPQYLRRALFPMHSDLSCAGLLNPLDCPHHVRANEWSVYREGIVVDRPLKDKEGSHVNVGLQREVVVDKRLQPGVRVTVKIDESTKDHKKKMLGKLVSSAEPREQLGQYWGYTARFAASLSAVWNECPFKGGYDLKIGASATATETVHDGGFALPSYRHALIVFGGGAGLEECVDADETIPVSGDEAASLFDKWVQTCPSQGSRTIRSEEAVLISLMGLRHQLSVHGRKG